MFDAITGRYFARVRNDDHIQQVDTVRRSRGECKLGNNGLTVILLGVRMQYFVSVLFQVDGVAHENGNTFIVIATVRNSVDDDGIRNNGIGQAKRQLADSATGTELDTTALASVVDLGSGRNGVDVVSTCLDDVFDRYDSVAVVAIFLTRHVLEGDVNGVVRDSSRSLVERSHYALVEIHSQFILTGRNTEAAIRHAERVGPSGMIEQEVILFACIAVSVYIVPTALVAVFSQCIEECEITGVFGKGEDAFEYLVRNTGKRCTLSRVPTGVVADKVEVLNRNRNADVELAVRRSRSNEAVVCRCNRICAKAFCRSGSYIEVVSYIESYTIDVAADNRSFANFRQCGNTSGIIISDGEYDGTPIRAKS